MKVVIMAGGKGTRIASVNSEVPKPMIPILEKPILEYQIEVLKKQGYTDIILVVGFLGNKIREYFGDGSKISPVTKKAFGVNIKYIVENAPLGTAGALYLLEKELRDDFLLINGDIIFDVNIRRFYDFHKSKGGVATLFTHPNDHPYDSGVIVTNNQHLIVNWMHKEEERCWYSNCVNAGLHLFSPKIFEEGKILGLFNKLKKLDLDRDILKPLIKKRLIYSYQSPEYVKDMGTPERYQAVTTDIMSGKMYNKNLLKKQKAIFLDRDGTLNRYKGFLRDIDDFELLPDVSKAIKLINESGYLAIVVTNQPVIARGEVTEEQLNTIHAKMETLLGAQGAYIDAIYVCPHHPHKGFEGEIEELKIDCNCRKPKPGLLIKAAKDYNIDLSQSWMIGDNESDEQAGINAGCRTVLMQRNGSLLSEIKKIL